MALEHIACQTLDHPRQYVDFFWVSMCQSSHRLGNPFLKGNLKDKFYFCLIAMQEKSSMFLSAK